MLFFDFFGSVGSSEVDSEESLFPTFAVTKCHLARWGAFDTAHLSAKAKAVGVFLAARFGSRVIRYFVEP